MGVASRLRIELPKIDLISLCTTHCKLLNTAPLLFSIGSTPIVRTIQTITTHHLAPLAANWHASQVSASCRLNGVVRTKTRHHHPNCATNSFQRLHVAAQFIIPIASCHRRLLFESQRFSTQEPVSENYGIWADVLEIISNLVFVPAEKCIRLSSAQISSWALKFPTPDQVTTSRGSLFMQTVQNSRTASIISLCVPISLFSLFARPLW